MCQFNSIDGALVASFGTDGAMKEYQISLSVDLAGVVNVWNVKIGLEEDWDVPCYGLTARLSGRPFHSLPNEHLMIKS